MLSFMKPEYAHAESVIFILGFARLFDMAAGLNLVILTVTRFYRVEALLAVVLLLLVIITNYIFIPIYGINGAAIATTAVFLFFNISVFLFIWIRLKMQPFTRNTLNVLLLAAAAAAVVWFIPTPFHSRLLNIAFRSTLFISLYFTPVYLMNISPDINTMVNNFSKKLFK